MDRVAAGGIQLHCRPGDRLMSGGVGDLAGHAPFSAGEGVGGHDHERKQRQRERFTHEVALLLF